MTIRHANRIIVLDHGRIVEQGSHDDLMARGGHYSELYNTYFRHQSPDYRPPEIRPTNRIPRTRMPCLDPTRSAGGIFRLNSVILRQSTNYWLADRS